METPGSLPDSHAAELDSTSLSPSRKLALGQEWRRPGDPPSYGPSAVEMDQVGCCRQVHARLPHPRLCECGTLAVGVPTEEPKSRKLGGVGGSLRRVPGPPLAVALAMTREGKKRAVPRRAAHKAPSADALTWHGPSFTFLPSSLDQN